MTKNKNLFRGTGVALVTPFQNGKVDYKALERVVNHCIDGGVNYLVVLGTTGEVPTLSKEEKFKILDFVVRINDGRLPIVAGFGGNNTKAIINTIKMYHFDGVDAILSSSPAYNKPSQEGIYQHYMALAEATPRPIIMYNVPSRTSSNINAETVIRLATTSRKFLGIKEAAYDLGQATEIIKYTPPSFLTLSGDDTIALPLLSIGGDGIISVIGNALPQHFSDMIRLGLEGNFKEAAKIHLRLWDIHQWLYKDGNPAGVKAALEIMGICSQETRLPLVPVTTEVYEKLKMALTDINAILPNDLIA